MEVKRQTTFDPRIKMPKQTDRLPIDFTPLPVFQIFTLGLVYIDM